MPECGNEKADICLKDREQMSAFWMKWILILYKCSQKNRTQGCFNSSKCIIK